MFRSASQIDSERTASSLRRIKGNWERTADSWFTGSVDSIDRRIDLCERLIHQASQATARLIHRPESAHYIKLANDLQADHQALTQMRRDLLTASTDRLAYSDECLEGPDGCDGEVYEREALSGSGMTYPRCDKHYQEYVDRVGPQIEETRRRYPDSDTPPSWFDPSYAGESWNDDY